MKFLVTFVALLLASVASGQTVEVKVGDSTLMDNAGAAVTAYFPSATADLSMGMANGHFVLGADLKRQWRGWDVAIGDTAYSFSMPGSGLGLATRGISFTKKTNKQSLTVFIGLAGQMYSAPYFETVNGHNFGTGLMFRRQVNDRLELTTMEIIAGNLKTASEGISYHTSKFRGDGGGGVLENRPYLFGNFAVQPLKQLLLDVGHSNSFYQNSRLSVNNESASLTVGAWSFNANAFQGRTVLGNTAGQTIGVDARLGIFNASASYMHSAYGSIIVGNVSENIGQHFHVSQYATEQNNHLSITAGGGYTGNAATVDVSYNEYFMPLNIGRSPFQQALTIQLSFHAPHDIALNASTYLLPNGKLRMTVFGDTFAKGPFNGNGREPEAGNTGKYVVRFHVVDQKGEPVEGAAVQCGKNLAITDDTGNAFIRVKTARSMVCAGSVDQFVAPGHWAAGPPVAATPALDPQPVNITVTLVR